VAINGNTGGCDMLTLTRVPVGLQVFFRSQLFDVDITALCLCLTVGIGEGIMSEWWNNRGIRHTQGLGDAT
jgi:hypothetical protein